MQNTNNIYPEFSAETFARMSGDEQLEYLEHIDEMQMLREAQEEREAREAGQ